MSDAWGDGHSGFVAVVVSAVIMSVFEKLSMTSSSLTDPFSARIISAATLRNHSDDTPMFVPLPTSSAVTRYATAVCVGVSMSSSANTLTIPVSRSLSPKAANRARSTW